MKGLEPLTYWFVVLHYIHFCNIYAEKTYGDKPVGLKLDNKTAQALKGTLYIRKNGADVIGLEKDNGTYLKQIVVDTDKLTTLDDLQADRVEIVAAIADVKITASTIVKEIYVTDKGYGRIDLSGTIGKLQADNAITVKGSGRIDEKSGKVEVTEDVKIGVTSVTLDKTDLTLDVNDTEKLTVTVNPNDATNKTVTWKSDKPEIVEVDSNGNVTAKAAGTATITATVDGKSVSCKVTVNGQTTVPVASVELNQTTLELIAGKEATLTATVKPDDATNKTVTWSSNNETVATVDNNGKVTAKAAGEATITAKVGDKQVTCNVKVTAAEVAVESVTLDQSSLELIAGKEATLTATVKPDNATNRTVAWESNATNVATVDNNGKVTAKAAGEAIITAKVGDKQATCTVTVTKADVKVTQITISGKNTLNVNDVATLTADVQPGDATNKTVVWTSENPDVVKVENGKVTALMPGQAVIKATAQDGSNTVGMFTIKVNVSNVDTLRTKVATARELMKDIQVSSDGTDVAPTEKWVPQAQKAALDTAVAEAEKILTAPLTSQNTVNAAYTKLQNAMTDFQKAMKLGTMPNTPMPLSFWDLW